MMTCQTRAAKCDVRNAERLRASLGQDAQARTDKRCVRAMRAMRYRDTTQDDAGQPEAREPLLQRRHQATEFVSQPGNLWNARRDTIPAEWVATRCWALHRALSGSTVGQHPSWARNQRVSMVPPEVYWLRYTWVKSACYGILGRASTMYIHAREKAATPVGAGRMACHKSLGWWTRNSENQQRAMRNVGYLIISKRYVDESPRADDNPPSPGQGDVVWQYDSLLRLAMPRHAEACHEKHTPIQDIYTVLACV